MREYISPELDVVCLDDDDVIYTSNEKTNKTNVINMTGTDFDPFAGGDS